MSRHRNVRTMNYDEDYEGYDDVYGHSMDDDYGVSPSVSEYLYDRSKQHQVSSFINRGRQRSESIAEEPEEETSATMDRALKRLDSLTIASDIKKLSAEDEVRLQSCLDEIHNVVGDSIPELVIKSAILQHDFNMEKALDACLKGTISLGAPSSKEPIRVSTKKDDEDNDLIGKNVVKPPPILAPKVISSGPRHISEPVKVVPASKSTVTKGFDLPKEKDRIQSVSSRPVTRSPIPEEPPAKAQKLSKEFKPDSALREYSKARAESKDLLNLLVMGHVDAGKSTLMGHLLFQLGQVPKKTMHKYDQESKKLGKQSFMYAWVLDETGEERSRGITMDVGQSKFETDSKSIILMDAPGHKDFIPNMITGASQADVAILVVDSTRGEFETGFESGGQTREHALLVRSLGVNQLVVAVNKLDTVQWCQQRFDEIRSKLLVFLTKQAGFKESDITFVPCSGLMGDNLSKTPEDKVELTSWYKGPTLLKAIDSFKPLERPVGKPLRITVGDVFKGPGGVSVAGKVETGMVQQGDKILVQPVGEIVSVKAITVDEDQKQAFAGDSVILTLQGGSDANILYVGCVLSDPNYPCKLSSRLQARIVTFDAMNIPLTKGFTGVMHLSSMSEQVVVKKLISQLNKGTGEVVKLKPRCLAKNCNGVIELETARPVCIEEFKDVKELGRFTLRYAGVTVAAGVVSKVL